ncbi:STAS-like domain-containing protein, partial [Campylobacter coli]|nr:STAS-like domain-containing protein [Campylobacter coli]
KSGEEFREDVLKPMLKEYDFIDIDGTDITSSFNPSFLSEAFGVLAEELGGSEELLKRIRLYSRKNLGLEEKFKEYIDI